MIGGGPGSDLGERVERALEALLRTIEPIGRHSAQTRVGHRGQTVKTVVCQVALALDDFLDVVPDDPEPLDRCAPGHCGALNWYEVRALLVEVRHRLRLYLADVPDERLSGPPAGPGRDASLADQIERLGVRDVEAAVRLIGGQLDALSADQAARRRQASARAHRD